MANIQKKYIILSSIVVVLAVILILTVTLKNKGYSLPQFKTINTQLSDSLLTAVSPFKRQVMDNTG